MCSQASCIAVGCYSGSDNGHCGHHMHSPIKMVSRIYKKKQKQETYWRLKTTCLKPLAFPLIGCYRSDGGGSGNGHCGRRMHSPVKKKLVELKNKKQKDLPKAQDMSSRASCIVG